MIFMTFPLAPAGSLAAKALARKTGALKFTASWASHRAGSRVATSSPTNMAALLTSRVGAAERRDAERPAGVPALHASVRSAGNTAAAPPPCEFSPPVQSLRGRSRGNASRRPAVCGKIERQRLPDADGGAGDQCDAAVESFWARAGGVGAARPWNPACRHDLAAEALAKICGCEICLVAYSPSIRWRDRIAQTCAEYRQKEG